MLKAVGATLKNVAKNHKGAAFNVALGGFFAADTYKESRENGDGVLWSAAKAGSDFVLPFLLSPALYMGYEAVTGLPGAVIGTSEWYRDASRQAALEKRNAAFSNSHFNDTEQAYTMRQAGMAMAERSRYNVQQAMLGNEAKYMLR